MNCRKLLFSLFLALLCALPLSAQVGLSIKLNRMTYMIYEPVHSFIALRNDTGRALVFGSHPQLQGFILFDIRDQHNRLVPKKKNAEIHIKNLLINAGETKPLFFQIDRFYDLSRPGIYRIKVYISHPQLPHDFESKEAIFWVAKGSTLWKKTVGLPKLDDKKDEDIQSRTYSIRALFDGQVRYYYLVVEDEDHIYGVMRLGKALGQEKIHAQVDMLSRIHVLNPISTNVHHYLSFALDGGNTINQYWKNTETIPTLVRNRDGKVFIVGGTPALPGIDYKPNDPKLKNAAQLTKEFEEAYQLSRPANQSGTKKNEGLIDLGKTVEN